MSPNVIGVDLSLTGTGVASSHGWCELVGSKGISTLPILERVAALHKLRGRIIHAMGTPRLLMIESPTVARLNGAAWERGWLWYAVVGSVLARAIPVVEVAAAQLKLYATGKGTANKGQIIEAVTRRWPQFSIAGDDNLADAAVLAAMGADLLEQPLAIMPAAHRAALGKLRLPAELEAVNA